MMCPVKDLFGPPESLWKSLLPLGQAEGIVLAVLHCQSATVLGMVRVVMMCLLGSPSLIGGHILTQIELIKNSF